MFKCPEGEDSRQVSAPLETGRKRHQSVRWRATIYSGLDCFHYTFAVCTMCNISKCVTRAARFTTAPTAVLCSFVTDNVFSRVRTRLSIHIHLVFIFTLVYSQILLLKATHCFTFFLLNGPRPSVRLHTPLVSCNIFKRLMLH